MLMRHTLLATLLAFSTGMAAAPMPYNETANAGTEVEQALTQATATQKPVLLIFGANWCEDCRALDAAMKNTKNASLVASKFVVVKIDVGNFDKNLPLTRQYGNPTSGGIPAAVIVSPDNQVLYTTRAGELANARRMSKTGVYDFFRNAASLTQIKK